ncbi:MAG: ROK family protein [Gracilimonas sp.]|nr:ROK family protein [Gracilimonas sp.]
MDKPLILTLDAGGTNFSFSAIQNGRQVGDSIILPAQVEDLDICLKHIITGFQSLIKNINRLPDAISFAFPGPADYENGIIGDLPNLPAFRNGVPLGPILEDEFNVPVFINNDGNLFALGESKAGLLPSINDKLAKFGNPKRYQNLIGITLGTGFGAGNSINGNLLRGDNSIAAEVWKLRNKRHPYTSVEDTISIRALKRMYAEQIAIDPSSAPEPAELYRIAMGESEGVQEAAKEAFMRFGDVLGDAIANIVTIIDGLVVLGGGISGAYSLFRGTMMDQLRSTFDQLNGERPNRLIQEMYDLEKERELQLFLENENRNVTVPTSARKVNYVEMKKSGIGLSRLGTSEAISTGAYYFAVSKLHQHS